MPLGSFAHDALSDLDDTALARMLELDETLFVEHKAGIGKDSAHGLVKTVASFANTAGGWLLLGVKDRKPNGSTESWAQSETAAPTLVDAVRDRLRGEIDPLPAFEAKVLQHPEGPVGVVRVYESSDTPHVSLGTGAVFVREVAGVADAASAGKPGPGKKGERVYRATQIRSRQQLLELGDRGRRAADRVDQLLDPLRQLSLIASELLAFELVSADRVQPTNTNRAAIVARVAPFTLAPRFLGWSTTSEAAASVIAAGEELSRRRGLGNDWVQPDPSGAVLHVEAEAGARHHDLVHSPLPAFTHIVLDGAGVAGAGLELGGAATEGRRRAIVLNDLAQDVIAPVIRAAAEVLTHGEFLGRARCQVDLIRMGVAMDLEEGGNPRGRYWVPTAGDLALPLDEEQLAAVAQRAANAYGRSADIPAWD